MPERGLSLAAAQRNLASAMAEAAPDWRDQIFSALKAADIRQVGYVPDAGHSRLIELVEADPQIRAVSLTTEEEGIALAAGAWLGGQRCALLMHRRGSATASTCCRWRKPAASR
jgi:hypothetical protein